MSQSNQRNEINILFSGYSDMINDTTMLANCTCTLIQGKNTKIIVDTRTAWDADEIIAGMPSRISFPIFFLIILNIFSRIEEICFGTK